VREACGRGHSHGTHRPGASTVWLFVAQCVMVAPHVQELRTCQR
jgi:hypothetical protein